MRSNLIRGLLFVCALVAFVVAAPGCDRCCRVRESYCSAPPAYPVHYGKYARHHRSHNDCD